MSLTNLMNIIDNIYSEGKMPNLIGMRKYDFGKGCRSLKEINYCPLHMSTFNSFAIWFNFLDSLTKIFYSKANYPVLLNLQPGFYLDSKDREVLTRSSKADCPVRLITTCQLARGYRPSSISTIKY